MLIGLTGQIGAGKSTAALMLKSFGAAIVDADKIGRLVVDNNRSVLKKLSSAFGSEIITASGSLRRKKLAELAFATEAGRKKLNSIVHPSLLTELDRSVKEALKKNDVVIIDAALLLEWELDKAVDQTIVIHTSLERRLAFLSERGISARDALARKSQQLSYAQYRKRADFLILNSGTKEQLRAKLQKLWDKIILT